MCVNFPNLNFVCPKDLYPLPNIVRPIDLSSGYKILSFIDIYSGYNFIKLDHIDAPKSAFMSNHNNYYYNVLPFRLKNIGATH